HFEVRPSSRLLSEHHQSGLNGWVEEMTTPGTAPGTPHRQEAGTVTAEFAVGLPGVVATVLLVLGMLLAGTSHVQCQEAARAGAREAMLHGSSSEAAAAAEKVAGNGAAVTVSFDGRWATVRVEKPLIISGIPLRVSAHMTAPIEGRSAA